MVAQDDATRLQPPPVCYAVINNLRNATRLNNALAEGGEKLVLDGLFYNANSCWTSAGERVSWDYEHRKSEWCYAAVTTDGEFALKCMREEHSHEQRAKRAEVLDTLHKVRSDVAESDTKPAAVVNHRVRKRLHAYLSSERNIVRAVYHVRRSQFPAEPKAANLLSSVTICFPGK